MRIPRDTGGEDLAKILEKVGYRVTRQTGSHMRLTATGPCEHHLTIPRHKSLRLGTLNGILTDVARHLSISKHELVRRIWAHEDEPGT